MVTGGHSLSYGHRVVRVPRCHRRCRCCCCRRIVGFERVALCCSVLTWLSPLLLLLLVLLVLLLPLPPLLVVVFVIADAGAGAGAGAASRCCHTLHCCCCHTLLSHAADAARLKVFANAWSLRGTVSVAAAAGGGTVVDAVVSSNRSEVDVLLQQGYSEVCNPVPGPTVFCVDSGMADGRAGYVCIHCRFCFCFWLAGWLADGRFAYDWFAKHRLCAAG